MYKRDNEDNDIQLAKGDFVLRILQNRMVRFVALLFLIVLVLLISFHVVESNRIDKFNLSEYSSELNQFPCEDYLGKIENITDLKTKVDDLFYLEFNKRSNFILPLLVSYDSEEECYLISMSLFPG